MVKLESALYVTGLLTDQNFLLDFLFSSPILQTSGLSGG